MSPSFTNNSEFSKFQKFEFVSASRYCKIEDKRFFLHIQFVLHSSSFMTVMVIFFDNFKSFCAMLRTIFAILKIQKQDFIKNGSKCFV